MFAVLTTEIGPTFLYGMPQAIFIVTILFAKSASLQGSYKLIMTLCLVKSANINSAPIFLIYNNSYCKSTNISVQENLANLERAVFSLN